MANFLIGLGCGVLAGVLFAPQSGRACRNLIRRQGRELTDSALDIVDRGKGILNSNEDYFIDAYRRVA
jgi:gas vesicle protein